MTRVGIVRREFGFPSSWVVWAVRAAVVSLVTYAFVAGTRGTPLGAPGGVGAPTTTASGVGVWTLVGYLVGLLFLALVADLPATDRPALLKWTEAAVLGLVLLDTLGGLIGWYRQFGQYDHVVHFTAGLLLVLVIYGLAEGLGWSSLWRHGTRMETFVHALAVVVMLGVFWEFFEAALDLANVSNPVRNFYGSTFDLVADTLGAFVGALIGAFTASGRDAAEPAHRRARGARMG